MEWNIEKFGTRAEISRQISEEPCPLIVKNVVSQLSMEFDGNAEFKLATHGRIDEGKGEITVFIEVG